ncbi:MAG TPA: hypothetical protein VG604_01930 [Candidatus Saccharimonadales bacterium]|nr:hypothetical protein [Candidatus Saccharimonadales bacterium]
MASPEGHRISRGITAGVAASAAFLTAGCADFGGGDYGLSHSDKAAAVSRINSYGLEKGAALLRPLLAKPDETNYGNTLFDGSVSVSYFPKQQELTVFNQEKAAAHKDGKSTILSNQVQITYSVAPTTAIYETGRLDQQDLQAAFTTPGSLRTTRISAFCNFLRTQHQIDNSKHHGIASTTEETVSIDGYAYGEGGSLNLEFLGDKAFEDGGTGDFDAFPIDSVDDLNSNISLLQSQVSLALSQPVPYS